MSPDLTSLHQGLGIPADYAETRGLPAHAEAMTGELVEVALNDEGRAIRLIVAAAAAWYAMREAAAQVEIELIPVSGFRAVSRQAEIIQVKLDAGQSLDAILRYVAAPGFSEHHTGRAIDIASPEHIDLDEEFEHTAAYRWLANHAHGFGFKLSYPRGNTFGIGYEPWHWCWQASELSAP